MKPNYQYKTITTGDIRQMRQQPSITTKYSSQSPHRYKATTMHEAQINYSPEWDSIWIHKTKQDNDEKCTTEWIPKVLVHQAANFFALLMSATTIHSPSLSQNLQHTQSKGLWLIPVKQIRQTNISFRIPFMAKDRTFSNTACAWVEH